MILNKLARILAIGAALATGFAAPGPSQAAVVVGISVGFAPPALPVYVQPVCPGDGYLWNPGYWAYGPEGYYWVPGVWVQPPSVGLLWTPPYWGFEGGVYGFHAGYWGPHVGFYGGINYGFGFGGVGFVGGHWDGGHFFYNSAVLNVGAGFHGNVFVDRTVIVHNNFSHVAFNGGPGGIVARPNAQEMAYAHENHVGPTPMQQSHFDAARADRSNFASANGGHPTNAAFSRPGSNVGAVHAVGAPGRPGSAPEGGAARPGAAAANRPEGQPAARPQTQPAARPQESRPAPQREQSKGKPPAR